MLHLLTNPGVFHPAITIFGIPELVFATILLIAGIFLTFAIHGGDLVKTRKRIILTGLTLLVAAIGITAGIPLVVHEESQKELLQTKYDSSVISWLDTGYGIKTNTDVAQRLIGGESFAVVYHSKEIVVSIIETINGKLAVIDQNRTVLKPAE